MDYPPPEVIPEPEIRIRPREEWPAPKWTTFDPPRKETIEVDYFARDESRVAFKDWLERVGPLDLPAYVYYLYDEYNRILYIGSTFNVKTRLQTHWRKQDWIDEVARVEWEMYESRSAAYDIEDTKIKELQPIYNKYGAGSKQPRRRSEM